MTNLIILVGRIARDPEARQTQGGTAVTTISVATDRPARNKEGKTYKVYATEKAYHVPEIVTKKDPHGIRIGKSILQCEIPQDQMLKLISTGKTDVLKGFVSNRTKRKFDAHLTFDPKDGKIGFEFMQRAAKAPAKTAAGVRPSTDLSRVAYCSTCNLTWANGADSPNACRWAAAPSPRAAVLTSKATACV